MPKLNAIPDFRFEADLIASGAPVVAGVDEVGRGPLAGPVTAAAVILDPQRIPTGLNDSKAIPVKRREALVLELEACTEIGIGWASVAVYIVVIAVVIVGLAVGVVALGRGRSARAI